MSAGPPKKIGPGRLPDHRHCPLCGRVMLPDADFCSKECRDKNEERLKRERRSRRIILIVYILLIASLFFIFFRAPA
ncbi:MAG: DUF2116 family Zn-ribbon domain-containing protein [Aigarchaeota archaeon]|nr:DUF2116 family Zn-ribbon domain-containing protein [Aigarchaeota archaeon]MDW8093101.1 DUF2116 family Zn-ribbon domain-containing protein [Nitrososphaerota archaeon]